MQITKASMVWTGLLFFGRAVRKGPTRFAPGETGS